MSTTSKVKQECTQQALPNDDVFTLGSAITGFKELEDSAQYLSLLTVHIQSTTTGKWVEGFGYITSSGLVNVKVHKIEDTSVNTVLVPDLDMIDFGAEVLEIFVAPGADEAFNIKKGKLGIVEWFQSNTHGFNEENSANVDPVANNIVQMARKGRYVVDDSATTAGRFIPESFYLPVKAQEDMHHVTPMAPGAFSTWAFGDGGSSNNRQQRTNCWTQYFADHVAKNLAPLGEVCRISCVDGGRGFESGNGALGTPGGSMIYDIIDRCNEFWAENPYNYIMFVNGCGGETDATDATDTTNFESEYDNFWDYIRNDTDGRLKFNAIQNADLWGHVSGVNCCIGENPTNISNEDERPVDINRSLMEAPYRAGNHRLAMVPASGIVATPGGDLLHFTAAEQTLMGQRAIEAIDRANNNNSDGAVSYAPDSAPGFVSLKRASDTTVTLVVWENHAFPAISTNGIEVEVWDKITNPTSEIWAAAGGSPFTQTSAASRPTTMHMVLTLTSVAAAITWGLRVRNVNATGNGPWAVLQDINPLMVELRDPTSSGDGIYPNVTNASNNADFWTDRSQNGFHAINDTPDSNLTYQRGVDEDAPDFSRTGSNLDNGFWIAEPTTHDGRDVTDIWCESFTQLIRFWADNTSNTGSILGTDNDGISGGNRIDLQVDAAGTQIRAGSIINSVQDMAIVTRSLTGKINQWLSVGLVYDHAASTLTLYYGDATTEFAQADQGVSYTSPPPVATQALKMGSSNASSFFLEFDGKEADCCLWNAAMSITDLKDKMKTWNPVKALPLNLFV